VGHVQRRRTSALAHLEEMGLAFAGRQGDRAFGTADCGQPSRDGSSHPVERRPPSDN
jgi:hypothetical protein